MAGKAGTSIAGHAGGDVKFAFHQGHLTNVLFTLDRVAQDMRKKAVRKGVSAGGRVLRTGIKQKAPVNTDQTANQRGLLKRSISVRHKTYKRSTLFYSVVGAKWLDQPKNPAKYIHILETGGQVYSRGLNPFATRAFDANATRARLMVINTIKDEIKKIKGAR
jgi:HK97 gp10 family phage protein